MCPFQLPTPCSAQQRFVIDASKRPGAWLLLIGFCLLAGLPTASYAQEMKPHPRKFWVDTLGRYYFQAEMPIYFSIAHDTTQTPTRLNHEDPKTGEMKDTPIYMDGHGRHNLQHLHLPNRVLDMLPLFADGKTPTSKLRLGEANRFEGDSVVYYGRGLVAELLATDEMSGVEEVNLSINRAPYRVNTQPVPLGTEGSYVLKYYAVDHVGNAEDPQTTAFTVDVTAPESYHNIVGINRDDIISTSTRIYLTVNDSLAGVRQTFFRFDSSEYQPYKGGIIAIKELAEGHHTLYYYSEDQVGNRESEKSVSFFLDKSSPIMSADILGDKFLVDDKIYFSGRTKLKLTAVDNKSGVKRVMYSVDEDTFRVYQQPFYLPSVAGLHVVRYYGVDEMENQGTGEQDFSVEEFRHNVSTVYVDLTGPTLEYSYEGPTFQKGDTMFITRTTDVVFKAEDPESGLQKVQYSLDQPEPEIPYEAPVRIPDEGLHQVYIYGYDNVNNRNIQEFTVFVDNSAPKLFSYFSIEPIGQSAGGLAIYPSYAKLFLAATDGLTDTEEIRYTINEGKTQTYTAPIQGFARGREYKIRITAIDKLGNETQEVILFETSEY